MRRFLCVYAFVAVQAMSFAATTSVMTAGATGNGSTDDTAAIQSALNSSAAGDTITFPAGTYRISSRITMPSNRTLQGQSGAIIKGSIGGALFQGTYNNARNITIDGLTFDGGGILFNGSSTAYPADSIKITHNRFQNIIVAGNYNADAIHAWTGTTNSQISFNTFTNIYDANHVAGWSEVCGAIWLFDPASTVITDNIFDKTCQAVHVTARQNNHDLSILRNTITGTARYNIEIQGPYSINNVLVNNNYIAQLQPGINGQAGISVAVVGTGHQILNNTLLGPNEGHPTNQSDAIESMGSGFLIQGNVAGHWGQAQLIGWSDATWSTKNNIWCDMTYPLATAI
ncbi:MAG TPA: glycosyl hydrolase family 28-related protein, partial [Bryobacteraceae bacterium]|nr:glycosyl hydrolase family 28-related protein [Bryobacteraceae bacterium]